ncbi:hypothetical protein KI387_021296, partial [Taxus chinensis]
EQSTHNESVKEWLLDVANIAWDAEDVLEECAVESGLINRYKMGRRIKDIRDRM